MFLAHEKTYDTNFFRAWTAAAARSKYWPPKYWWVVTFLSFCIVHAYVSALIVFSWSHSDYCMYSSLHTTCVVATSLVSIRTGLKSSIVWDWSTVRYPYHFSKQQQHPIYIYKMGIDLVYTCIRRLYESIITHDTSCHTCRGNNVWLLIGSKFAKKKARQSRQSQTTPKTGTMRGWPIAGLLACDLYLVLECTCFRH